MSFASSADAGAAGAGTGLEARARTLVVGLGNPLLGDDGIGWRVVDALAERLGELHASGRATPIAELDQLAVGGLTLMERLVGYECAILVDAVASGADEDGTVTCRALSDVQVRGASHLDSAHDAPILVALAAGRALGAPLPSEIWVVGIETQPQESFGEALSPAVASSVPEAAAAVLALLHP